MTKTAITPTRNEDYPQWYQQVIINADLAENSSVRGCMVIKPWGYAIWELIQSDLDYRFKQTNHVNAYFPLLIPLSNLEKEAEHVEGFAKECAVVTHHRLVGNGEGGLMPDGKLEEPYVIRPTSETIIGESFARWIKSYRDLPLLINQWANVMRWEMRTRLFLRTSEFLWQEGHTAHRTEAEALDETLSVLDLYADFAHSVMALPVIKGEKPCFERFPGAVNTYCIEAMMQDAKALQAGTSHFLGQNFARASNIEFLDQDGSQRHVWTTSWGVTTRLIGGLIMVHSDDNGLVLPPKLAPKQIVILPIYRDETQAQLVLDYCNQLKNKLTKLKFNQHELRVLVDTRDIRGGEKNWEWIKKGVPLKIEIGPRDIHENSLILIRRDNISEKIKLNIQEFRRTVIKILTDIQANLLFRAKEFSAARIKPLNSLDEFNAFFANENNIDAGFGVAFALDDFIIEKFIKPLKVTCRCIPLSSHGETGICIFTGKRNAKKMIFARAY